MSPTKKAFGLDFNLYLGDPDDGVEQVTSAEALSKIDSYKDQLPFDDGVYGCLTLEVGAKSVLDAIPDPIAKMLISLVRVLPYVLEGEPETALMQESEHGFLLEPNGENVLFSVFSGSDAYEPDDYLVEAESLPLLEFGDQMIKMSQRLVDIFKKHDGESRDSEAIEDLEQVLDVAQDAVKSARLKDEHGIRHH